MKEIYNELLEYSSGLAVMNTHSHQLPDDELNEMDLEKLISLTYLKWCGVNLNRTFESREQFINKLRFNSYYVWFSKALQDLNEVDEKLSPENWDEYSAKIREAYNKKSFRRKLLLEKCKYEKVIVDAYWNPGDTLRDYSIMSSTYRLNIFFFGYSLEAKDHNGTNPYLAKVIKPVATLDEYISLMKQSIVEKVHKGSVALKIAIAYDRGLDFNRVSKECAEKGFMNEKASEEDIDNFQNYLFYQICEIVAQLDIPLQCHTGLAKLAKSSVRYLEQAICDHPNTKFVIFHGSYPWFDDLCAIVNTYPNVYPDLCWVSQISTTACERLLHELIETSHSDKICWGCDTWISEDSYGALLAFRHVLAKVMAEKVHYNYMALEDAKDLIHRILYQNAKELYKF